MDKSSFNGLAVAAFESRMAVEMASLITRYGGTPHVVPALREIPLDDNPGAFQFAEHLFAGRIDLLIALTGVGMTTLVDVLKTRHTTESITRGLAKIPIVARGPKPVAALKALGLAPTITIPEPNTWRDILKTLDAEQPVTGLRVAVQEHGVPANEVEEGLVERGASVLRVPVYRWALPDDTRPLRRLAEQLMNGELDVLLVTNAAQIDHVVALLQGPSELDRFRRAARRLVVASIGPIASERLRSHGLPVDLEPSHPKMGVLVKETSERAQELLGKKRGTMNAER
jgi:uroporphyrinogen-III synthase